MKKILSFLKDKFKNKIQIIIIKNGYELLVCKVI